MPGLCITSLTFRPLMHLEQNMMVIGWITMQLISGTKAPTDIRTDCIDCEERTGRFEEIAPSDRPILQDSAGIVGESRQVQCRFKLNRFNWYYSEFISS